MHPSRPSDQDPEPGRGFARGAQVLVASFLVFALQFYICRELCSLGAFGENDILFDADIPCRWGSLAHGWCDDGRGLIHPNFANFFGLPPRAVARLVSMVVGIDDEVGLRRQLALLYAPLASSLQFSVVYLCLRRLELPRMQAGVLTLLLSVSFAQLIFGSIPESYALSSLAISTAYLLALEMPRIIPRFHMPLWIALGVVATGITLTNAVPLAVLSIAGLQRLGRSLIQAFAWTISMVGIVLLATVTLAHVFDTVYDVPPGLWKQSANRVNVYMGRDPVKRFKRFPRVVVQSIVSSNPTMQPITPARPDRKRPYRVLLDRNAGDLGEELVSGFVAVLMLLAIIALPLQRGWQRNFFVASLVIVGYNWVFHSLWGTVLFLYASHWLVALIILLAALSKVHPRLETAFTGAIVVASAGTALINLQNLEGIFRILRTHVQ